jgi:predicted dehydrogenase
MTMAYLPHRRDFQSAVALTALSYNAVAGANDRIRLGFIGVGNRGDQLLDAFTAHSDCEVVALCDVYQPYLAASMTKVGGLPRHYHDYRQMLDDRSLDAVVIATPDHWHALQFVDACRAGKDVYIEKPVSLTISEGRVMCRVAAEQRRVTQVGLHRRSAPRIREAIELIHAGEIGQVTVCKAYFHRNEVPLGIGRYQSTEVPNGLDWNLWLGPAPWSDYRSDRCLYKFRWFQDYSGGQITNQGTHYVDVFQWLLKQNAPRSVACLGGHYVVNDDRDIPDTLEAVWEYNGAICTFSQINGNGAPGNAIKANMEIRGTKGTLYITDSDAGYTILPETNRIEELPILDPRDRPQVRKQSAAVKSVGKAITVKGFGDSTKEHARDFLDCIRTRNTTRCPIEIGHRSTTTTLLARMAWTRHRQLDWDSAGERVMNDEDANKLLSYSYREPWKLT